MCRYSAPPGYVRSARAVGSGDRGDPESDKTAPPKQRHTAKRIFERLQLAHAYGGGYTVVKDYVRLARTQSREAYVPLALPPGHAQVDFGECIGVIGGVRMKLHVFCFDLPHSDAVSSRPIRRRRRKPSSPLTKSSLADSVLSSWHGGNQRWR
jgi:transposase